MAKKDWKGGKASVFKTIGASNHVKHERAHADYYATEPKATEWLLKLENFDGPILEPACGEGHISDVLIRGGGPFCNIERPYRPRLWRSGRLPFHRQSGMERKHCHQSTIRLRTRVCGKSSLNHTRREKSVHVFETDIPRRKRKKALIQDSTTEQSMGKLLATSMRHERKI